MMSLVFRLPRPKLRPGQWSHGVAETVGLSRICYTKPQQQTRALGTKTCSLLSPGTRTPEATAAALQRTCMLQQRRHLDTFILLSAAPAIAIYYAFTNFRLERDQFANSIGHTVQSPYGPIHLDLVDAGEPARPSGSSPPIPILFFHDTPGGGDQYRSICNISKLKLPRPVIAMSRPGYLTTAFKRRTKIPQISALHRYTLEHHTGEVETAEGVHLMAFGAGGLYALHFALSYPSLVKSIILISAISRRQIFTHSNGRDSRVIEGEALKKFLTQMAFGQTRIGYDIAEWANTVAFRNLSKPSLISLFRRELLDDNGVNIATELAEQFPPKHRLDEPTTVKLRTSEYSWSLLRALGSGSRYQKRLGIVNDTCNICGIELNMDATGTSRGMSTRNIFKDSKALYQAWKNQKTAKQEAGQSATSTTATVEDIMKFLKEQEAEIQKEEEASSRGLEQIVQDFPPEAASGVEARELLNDHRDLFEDLTQNDNKDQLKQIECPCLILHSPNDGKAHYATHALHAEDCLPQSKMLTFDRHPHGLHLISPDRVENFIVEFLSSVESRRLDK